MLELIIAIAMVSTAVVIVSLIFPKTSANITNNRRHWLASNFASARIQELKEKPYALIPTTPPGAVAFPTAGGYFASIAPAAGGCDCSAVDWANLALAPTEPPDRYTEDGVTFRRQVCIHLVEPDGAGGWTSYCPDPFLTNVTDKGLKNIRVRVSWESGTNTYAAGTEYFTETESMVTR